MSKKIKNTKTAEQRRAQAEELQASIAEQVDQLRNSDQWTRFLQFARSFYPYSVNNLILIMTQFPTASRVAGFRQWQAKGRQVRKGEKSIKIFGFAQKKIRNDDDHGHDREGRRGRGAGRHLLPGVERVRHQPDRPDRPRQRPRDPGRAAAQR